MIQGRLSMLPKPLLSMFTSRNDPRQVDLSNGPVLDTLLGQAFVWLPSFGELKILQNPIVLVVVGPVRPGPVRSGPFRYCSVCCILHFDIQHVLSLTTKHAHTHSFQKVGCVLNRFSFTRTALILSRASVYCMYNFL